MKQDLKKLVDKVLPHVLKHFNHTPTHGSKEVVYDIEKPKIGSHGDLSINLAFQLSRMLKKSPLEIAEIVKTTVETELKKRGEKSVLPIETISIAKPGFINFKIKDQYYVDQLHQIHKKDASFGKSKHGQGKKVIIEFVSANPTGPLTIAHGRQAAIGDTLARVMALCGYKPHKEFYLNDAGRQVRLLGESLWARYHNLSGENESIPEGGYQGDYLIDIARSLQAKKGKALEKLTKAQALPIVNDFAVNSMLNGIESDLADMRVRFDEYFSEKTLYEKHGVKKAIESLRKTGHIYESGGAVWFRSTDFGDDKDRVLIKKDGAYTYLAPDIAYHAWKFERKFDMLVNLWGPDHHGYVARMRAACQALGHVSEQLKILLVQLTTLYRNGNPIRMSTRQGQFVTLKELLDEVGVDAVRYFFLMRRVESHLDFDLELAKKTSDENPVYYVQYAHARISSILAFSKRKVDPKARLELIQTPEEIDLIRQMLVFPDVLIQAAERLEPYCLTDYARDLATSFHKFYTVCRVVSDDQELTKARLYLVDCVRIVLRNTLAALGVLAPTSM